MSWTTISELKAHLKREGFEQKAVLNADDMIRAQRLLDQDPRTISTPEDELRYIEGLVQLPFGYLRSFKVVPKMGHERCKCGRVPTALDLLHYALSRQVHSRDLIRDTLIGFSNIVEIAEDGRAAQCYRCGRPVVFVIYYKQDYMYC